MDWRRNNLQFSYVPQEKVGKSKEKLQNKSSQEKTWTTSSHHIISLQRIPANTTKDMYNQPASQNKLENWAHHNLFYGKKYTP